MAEAKEYLMTQAEYDALRDKLEYLNNEKTREIAEKINQARGYGDLSENAEYDAAKAEQAENAEFIRICEEKIKHAKVVDDDTIDKSTVNVGLIVKVLDVDFDEEFTYEITGTTGADPLNGKISVDSPVAKALVGKKKGQKVEVTTPDGETYQLKILSISKKK